MSRGDIVVIATRGTYTGKPRTALIVQSDLFNATHASITICPITSDVVDAPLFRVNIPPGDRTGLRVASQAMVDKVVSLPLASAGQTVGRLSLEEMSGVDDALRTWLTL